MGIIRDICAYVICTKVSCPGPNETHCKYQYHRKFGNCRKEHNVYNISLTEKFHGTNAIKKLIAHLSDIQK